MSPIFVVVVILFTISTSKPNSNFLLPIYSVYPYLCFILPIQTASTLSPFHFINKLYYISVIIINRFVLLFFWIIHSPPSPLYIHQTFVSYWKILSVCLMKPIFHCTYYTCIGWLLYCLVQCCTVHVSTVQLRTTREAISFSNLLLLISLQASRVHSTQYMYYNALCCKVLYITVPECTVE